MVIFLGRGEDAVVSDFTATVSYPIQSIERDTRLGVSELSIASGNHREEVSSIVILSQKMTSMLGMPTDKISR